MCINEAGQHGFRAQVNLAAAARREMKNILVRAHSNNASSADGHRLSSRGAVIDRPDVAVVENKIGFRAFERKECKCTHRANEVTPRRPEHEPTLRCICSWANLLA